MMKLLAVLFLQVTSARMLVDKQHHPCDDMMKEINEGRHHCKTMFTSEDAFEAVESGYRCRAMVNSAIDHGHKCLNHIEPLLGSDRDDFGCITSAGYTWCDKSETCLPINQVCVAQDS
jgi:hypothetical protein